MQIMDLRPIRFFALVATERAVKAAPPMEIPPPERANSGPSSSDQNLRSIVIAGRPDEGKPDWRRDGPQPMTDQQITDVLAWLASKRVANPGQPYPTHP
jgi:hypothetical protein